MPTLTDQDSLLEFISFTGNGTCELPCLANVTPGKTNWDEAVFTLHPMESVAELDILTNQESVYGPANVVSWYLSGDEIRINGKFLEGNEINLIRMDIETFSMPTTNADSYPIPLPTPLSMSSVLQEYGVPSMVFIYTFVHDQPGRLPFKILLVYPENQFYIEYYREAKLNGDSVVACNPDFRLELVVVDNKEKLLSVDALTNAPETKDLSIHAWKTVEQVMNISADRFHEVYSSSSSECIIFPSKVWLPCNPNLHNSKTG